MKRFVLKIFVKLFWSELKDLRMCGGDSLEVFFFATHRCVTYKMKKKNEKVFLFYFNACIVDYLTTSSR